MCVDQQCIDDDDDEGGNAAVLLGRLLLRYCCYDVMPNSCKVIILDIQLQVGYSHCGFSLPVCLPVCLSQ